MIKLDKTPLLAYDLSMLVGRPCFAICCFNSYYINWRYFAL